MEFLKIEDFSNRRYEHNRYIGAYVRNEETDFTNISEVLVLVFVKLMRILRTNLLVVAGCS